VGRDARATGGVACAAVQSDPGELQLFTTATATADSVPAMGKERKKTVGVLLLNLGGPETLSDVQPFLRNLFGDPDILRLSDALSWAQPLIASVIAVLRTRTAKQGYEAIGGGSPLRQTTDMQARALQRALVGKSQDAKVYVAMRYWHPFTEEAISAIKRDGVTDLVVLPLYPQFSVTTSGSSLRLLEKIFQEDAQLRGLKHTVIPSWYQRAGYISAMVNLIEKGLEGTSPSGSGTQHILFSAHGVPKSYVDEAGDPYKEEIEHTVDLIMREIGARGLEHGGYTLAYQSRVGPVEWLEPYTSDSIRYLAKQGVDSLLVVPISFVSEHIETLEEIDMEYRELAEENGITGWRRVPALGCDELFIDDLADAVINALPYVGLTSPADANEAMEPVLGDGGKQQLEALVPMGSVNALLDTYDGERMTIPLPEMIKEWEWGWTRSAELWNGRAAMFALSAVILFEIALGRPIFLLEPFRHLSDMMEAAGLK